MSVIVPLEQTGTLINFSKFPDKNAIKICKGVLNSHMQTHTNKHSEAKRRTGTTFHYKYAKKIIGSFLEMLPGIIFSGGKSEVYAKPPH